MTPCKLPPRSVATTGGIHATPRCFPPGTPSNPLASAQFRQRELHTLYSEHRCKMLGLVIVLPDKNQRNGQARNVVQERKSSLRRVQQCARQTVIIAGVTNKLITSRHGLAGYESRDANRLIRIGNHTGRNIVKTNFPVAVKDTNTLQRFRVLNKSKDADQIRLMGRFAACGFNDALNLSVKVRTENRLYRTPPP